MKKLNPRKRRLLENPIENLLDLFRHISRETNSEAIWEGEHCYELRRDTLFVGLERLEDGAEVREKLEIRQSWNSRNYELITYENRFENMQSWVAREIIDLIRNHGVSSGLLGSINACNRENDEPQFLSIEAFAANIEYVQIPKSLLKYETSDIGRGLQTLASLRMQTSVDRDEQQGEAFFTDLFQRMYHDEDVQEELARRLGERNRKQHKRILRLGKLECSKPYSTPLREACMPCGMGHMIVDICKFYIGILPKGIHCKQPG